MKYDMHVHTKYSRCSNLDPELILKTAKKKGLEGVGVVDHDQLSGALEVKRANKDKDFHVIIGEEFTTDKGHILGYNINEEIRERKLDIVIDKIREQGGIVVAAHPFRLLPHLKFKRDLSEIDIDAIEGLNGRVMFGFLNRKAMRKAEELGKAVTGGSDAHFTYEIGNCVSVFEGDFQKAVKLKKISVESSMFYGVKGFFGGCQSFLRKRLF